MPFHFDSTLQDLEQFRNSIEFDTRLDDIPATREALGSLVDEVIQNMIETRTELSASVQLSLKHIEKARVNLQEDRITGAWGQRQHSIMRLRQFGKNLNERFSCINISGRLHDITNVPVNSNEEMVQLEDEIKEFQLRIEECHKELEKAKQFWVLSPIINMQIETKLYSYHQSLAYSNERKQQLSAQMQKATMPGQMAEVTGTHISPVQYWTESLSNFAHSFTIETADGTATGPLELDEAKEKLTVFLEENIP